MKKIQLTLIALLGMAFMATAQTKNTGKAVISTPTIQCDMCKAKIEKYVSRQYGINSVKVDVKKKTTTVNWIPDRTNIEEVKTHIANVGYDADDVTKDETAYQKLPKCCKMPE